MEIDSLREELDELKLCIMQLEIEREAIRRVRNKVKATVVSMELEEWAEKCNRYKAKWECEKDVITGIQREKERIDKYKLGAEQAERAGDFGKVAEMRYGKIGGGEQKLESFKSQLAEMQAGSPL